MKRIKWGMILGMTMLLCMGFPSLGYVRAVSEDRLYFSARQHFYKEEVLLKLRGKPGCEIYYTTNGEIPSRESQLYTHPIQISPPENGVRVVTIRAVGYYKDGSMSPEQIHTYFVGSNVFERYHSLITVITSDPINLYDYDTGIFVEGRLRDEWRKENPSKTIKPSHPANYNLRGVESERDAYLEVFNPEGQRVLAQNVGIRVQGGWSRSADNKSLKIFARKEYGENTLNYEFFANCPEYLDDDMSYTYKRLVLRNNISIENTTMMRMLQEACLDDTQEYCFSCGYLNGDYYHSGWLMEVYDKNYFHSNYGTTEAEGYWGVVADYSEKVLDGRNITETAYTQEDIQPLLDKEYYDLFQNKNFQDDYIFEEFCNIVDVENMLRYFAIEIYMGNMDWPYNNIKMYRWYSYENIYSEASSSTDGKWRYLLYDLDGGFASGYDVNLLAHVLNKNDNAGRYHAIFANLMQREDMKAQFKEIMQELAETTFEPDKACQIIEETYVFSQMELSACLTEEEIDTDAVTARLAELEKQKEAMLEFARKRPEEIKKQMEELL